MERKIKKDKPWIRSIERERYVLRIAFIHARRGEHITGADLLFELKDKKILFIQSKRVGANGRFTFNRLQLLKLVELEAQLNFGRDSMIMQTFSQTIFYPIIPFQKTAFYHLVMVRSLQTQERFSHISEIMFTLDNRKSTSQNEFLNMGIKHDEFNDLFWSCKIGAPDLDEELKKDTLYFYSLATNRIILWLHIEEKIDRLSLHRLMMIGRLLISLMVD